MFKYTFTISNPDGVQSIMDFEHKKDFTHDEFDKMCYEAILYAYEKEYNERGIVFRSSPYYDYIYDYMLNQKGFEQPEPSKAFDFDPWAEECITDKKILQWINREKPKDKPEYMK